MSDFLSQIEEIVGSTGLISGDNVRQKPGDWLGKTECQAKAIIRPASSEELAEVMRTCHREKQSVIAAGGLTGLVHATDATSDDILISLERMRSVEALDPVGRTITVQAGIPMQTVQEAALEEGLLFAVDLGARGSATIGGNIATNAGGNQVLRYGMMREQVLGIEVVLADGTILSSMNTLLKNNTGYDLKHLFIGAEGTLGIVTRAVLRLQPLPKSEVTALVAIQDFDALIRFFKYVGDELGGALTAFEVMWKEHYQLIAVDTGRHTPPLAIGEAFYVVVEANGNDPDRDTESFTNMLGEALEKEIIADATIATSKSQSEAIWNIREDIEGLSHALMPAAVFDVSMPILKMEAYIEDLRKAVKSNCDDETKMIVFGHLGDGNLHIVISARPWSDEARNKLEQLVYEPLAAIGGSISAEHGIGLEKRDWLKLSRSDEEIAVMKSLKHALDPQGILNPGKIFKS